MIRVTYINPRTYHPIKLILLMLLCMNTLQQQLLFMVKAGLQERHWTQKRLADQLGCSENHLSRVLTNKYQVSLEFWGEMLEVLKVPGFQPISSIND